jgi:hypothetical protein
VLSPLKQVDERITRAREDSDVAYFYDLLHAGEMVVKLATAALTACLEDDRERHRYRIEYELIRADGLGAWSAALDDLLIGPASQVLSEQARAVQRELTQQFRLTERVWQSSAISLLHDARAAIDTDIDPLPARVPGRRWFADFVALRNRTRGHGATTPAACSAACQPLHQSIELVMDQLSLFRSSWTHLRRNLSGKYRVTDMGCGSQPFDRLRTGKDVTLADGIYVFVGAPRRVMLLSSDEDVRDFFCPNGGFDGSHYELLSYITDSRILADISGYVNPPSTLPESETQGVGELQLVGHAFANIPPRTREYVQRPELQEALASVLTNDRHPVVTLVGRGGTGKTSLALEVLHSIAHDGERFFAMVWFSARDIELLPEGPKLVRPHVLSPDEMAKEFASLLQPAERDQKSFKPLDYFASSLSKADAGPLLFVFDNFETVRNPLELYRWLDTHIRPPNKILITTRSRDFKGDYWVEVGGMTEAEFATLVEQTAAELGIRNLIDASYEAELYSESNGHPYIAKVMLGEVARAGKRQKVERVMASQDRVLEALFERTYSQLAPAAQRIFLTLSSWRSLVPMVALDAAVNRPENERLDVESAVDELRRSSLVDETSEDMGGRYVSVPLSAALFGRRKLTTSPWKTAIDADIEFLRLFGPVQASGARHGVKAQVIRLFQSVAERVQKRPQEFERYLPVLEFVSREQAIGWVLLAQLLEEQRPNQAWADDAVNAYRRYLEEVPDDGQIWRRLAEACTRTRDFAGSVQALVKRAQLPGSPYPDVSYAATKVNEYLHDGGLELDTDEKRILIASLVRVMEDRLDEADATDHSRLAWLLINSKNSARARGIVQAGLDVDPTNPHCLKLKAGLSRTRPAKAGGAKPAASNSRARK